MEILNQMLAWLIEGIHQVIAILGYFGVVILMAIESANIPIPSEFIMPYAGFMVQQGKLNFHLTALAGAIGCVVGSVPCYWLGYVGGRPFLRRYGKWLLLSESDLDTAENWTKKYGDLSFFICRMLPVLRTFISVPAGILKANFWPFTIYTFLGSLIWSYLLVWVGVQFGENLEAFREIWHKFDYAIVGILAILGVWYLYTHISHAFGHKRKSTVDTSELES